MLGALLTRSLRPRDQGPRTKDQRPTLMNNTSNSITNGVIRGVTAATGGGMALASHDDLVQLLGAILTVASIAWSIWEKRAAARNPQPPAPKP